MHTKIMMYLCSYHPNVGDWVKSHILLGGIAVKIQPLRQKEMTGIVTYTCVEERCFVKGKAFILICEK